MTVHVCLDCVGHFFAGCIIYWIVCYSVVYKLTEMKHRRRLARQRIAKCL